MAAIDIDALGVCDEQATEPTASSDFGLGIAEGLRDGRRAIDNAVTRGAVAVARKLRRREREVGTSVIVEADLTTHPDGVLRRMGVIEGHLINWPSKQKAYWDGARCAWVDKVKHNVVTKGVNYTRKDRVAKGVIHVQGVFDGGRADIEVRTAMLRDRIVRERLREKTAGAAGGGEDDGAEPVLLSDDETGALISQYIHNGIPEAALRNSACIVTRGTGPLANMLGEGISAVQDKCTERRRTTQYRPGHIVALGVHHSRDALAGEFTHHLVLTRPTHPVAPKQPHHRNVPDNKGPMDVSYTDLFKLCVPGEASPRHLPHTTHASPGTSRPDKRRVVGPQEVSARECSEFRCVHGLHGDHCRLLPKDDVPDVLPMHAVPPGAYDCLARTCECRRTLGPLEVARCVCGRFDFEHVHITYKVARLKHLHAQTLPGFAEAPHRHRILAALAFFCVEMPRPTERDVDEYKLHLLTVLAKGHSSDGYASHLSVGQQRKVPPRPAIPVVTVLFGGKVHEKFNLAKQVQRKWPIVVVEGSGEYADRLAALFNKVNSIVFKETAGQESAVRPMVLEGVGKTATRQAAGLDDFRRFLSGIDPITAEILVNGKVQMVQRGAGLAEFVRKVEFGLLGNEVLDTAWAVYAQWHINADVQEQRFLKMKLFIQGVSVLLTVFSVLITFSLIVSGTPTIRPSQPMVLQVAVSVLNWCVVILPVVLTTAHAIEKHEAAGSKWVALRSCSERLLSEIYMYRTRTCQYSKRSVQRAVRDGVGYASREELLQQRTKALIDTLSASEVSGITLLPYDGLVPPPWIRRTGDTGAELLSPDEYTKYRLLSTARRFERDAARLDKRHSFLTTTAYAMNTLGTILGATTLVGVAWLNVWVIVTIALETNISKAIACLRMPEVLKRTNTSVLGLANVDTWWASLGSQADRQVQRDQLVQETEDIILDVSLMWESLLFVAAGDEATGRAAAKKPAEHNESKRRDGEVQKLTRLSEEQDVNLGMMCQHKLEGVLQDGGEHDKAELLAQVKRLQRALRPEAEVDAAAGEDASDSGPTNAAAATARLEVERNSPMRDIGAIDFALDDMDMLTADLCERLVYSLRLVLKNRLSVTAAGIMRKVRALGDPWLEERLRYYTTRHLLEFVKFVAVHALHMTFPAGVRDAMRAEIAAQSTAALLAIGETQDTGCEIAAEEAVVSSLLTSFHPGPGGRLSAELATLSDPRMAAVAISRMRDPHVRRYLLSAPDEVREDIVRAAAAWYTPGSAASDVLDMYDMATARIAEHDVAVFLEDESTCCRLLPRITRMGALMESEQWRTVAKDSLLVLFPHAIARRVNQKTPHQLGRYMQQFIRGTPASRAFGAFHRRCDHLLARTQPVFHPERGDCELRERLAYAVATLDQISINRLDKTMLRRRFGMCPASNAALRDVVARADSEKMKLLFSAMLVKLRDTYAFKVIDRLGDDDAIDSNVVALLSRCAERLADRVSEFATLKLHELCKQTILIRMESKTLSSALSHVSEDMLRMLVSNVLESTRKLYPLLAYQHVLARLPFLVADPRFRFFTAAWGPDFVTTLVDAVASVNVSDDDESEATGTASASSEASDAASVENHAAHSGHLASFSVFVEAEEAAERATRPPRTVVRNAREFIGNVALDSVRVELSRVLEAFAAAVPAVSPDTWVPSSAGELLGTLAEAVDDFIGDATLVHLAEAALLGVLAQRNLRKARSNGRKRPRPRGRLARLTADAAPHTAASSASTDTPPVPPPPGPSGMGDDVLPTFLTNMLLGSHARRVELLRALSSLGTLEVHLLFPFPDRPGVLARHVTGGTDVIAVGEVLPLLDAAVSDSPAGRELSDQLAVLARFGDTAFKTALGSLINHLVFGAPLHLFYQLCEELATCNMRDVICGAAMRRDFIFMLYDLLHLAPPCLAGSIAHTTTTALEYAWHGLQPDAGDPCTVGAWKEELLDTVLRMPTGARYTALVDRLHKLTETQLRLAVVDLGLPLVTHTPVGSFFGRFLSKARAVCQAAATGGSHDATVPSDYAAWLQMHSLTHTLVQKARCPSGDASAAFAGFSGEAFVRQRGDPQQKTRLARLDLDPDDVDLLQSLSPAQLDSRFFSYLSARSAVPPVSRKAHTKTLARVREQLWERTRGV